MRTITLKFDQTALADMRLNLNLVDPDGKQLSAETIDAEIDKAIAYLSTWAQDTTRYAHCSLGISAASDEFVAIYAPYDNGPTAFVMGAVWHGTHFGFHS